MIWRLLASVLVNVRPRPTAATNNETGASDEQQQEQGGHLAGLPERRLTMNRDDVLVWLSVAWFVALCGAAIWVLFRL